MSEREGTERKPEPPHSQSQSTPADIWNKELHSTISDSFVPLCVETHSLIHAIIVRQLHLPAKIHHCWSVRNTKHSAACPKNQNFLCAHSSFLDAIQRHMIVWHFVLKWKDMQLFRFHKLNAALNSKNGKALGTLKLPSV